MFNGSRKPYSAITVQIDRLTAEAVDEDDLAGLFELLEIVGLQPAGPAEAARALRKKLKHGSVHQQLRALTIIDGVLQNGDGRLRQTLVDPALLGRLQALPQDSVAAVQVRAKCAQLYGYWARYFRDKAGMESVAALHRCLPDGVDNFRRSSRTAAGKQHAGKNNAGAGADAASASPFSDTNSTVASDVDATDVRKARSTATATATAPSQSPSHSLLSKIDKSLRKDKRFSVEKDKAKILRTIASASVASTQLLNQLQLIHADDDRVGNNDQALKEYDECQVVRARVMEYIQLVDSDVYIGSLLTANDELVRAIKAFKLLDSCARLETDSDGESAAPEPPRLAASHAAADPSDDEDPFGDQNAVGTA